MKIISWNLQNIGPKKLADKLKTTFSAWGLGNTVGDYILKVVMGDIAWAMIATTRPVDIFVMIEVVSDAGDPGTPASGNASTTVSTMMHAMNTVAGATPSLQNDYVYACVPPLNVGMEETVGVIYNTKRLTLPASGVLKDAAGNFFPERSPYAARFQVVGTNNSITVIGIHAPPIGWGGVNLQFRPPIDYLNRMITIPDFLDANRKMVMGDYNCAPNSTYDAGAGPVGWNWPPNYGTLIPNGTLSSLKKKPRSAINPTYLSMPYDNLLYNFDPGAGAVESVLDTILNARNMAATPPVPLYPRNVVAVANNFPSDHLPLYFEFAT